MAYSKGDRIKILPAIPDSWKELEFKNLRVPPGILASLKMKDGKLKNFTLKNETSQTIKRDIEISPNYLSRDMKKKVAKGVILKSYRKICL